MPKAMRRSQHDYCASPVRSTSIAVPPIRKDCNWDIGGSPLCEREMPVQLSTYKKLPA